MRFACELHDLSISYAVPRHASRWYAGAFERLTGHPAFNEWDEPPMAARRRA